MTTLASTTGQTSLAEVARRQNDRDFAAGLLPSRFVEDPAVLAAVAAMVATGTPVREERHAATKAS